MAKPVLKWAGGKTAILPEIHKRISKIDIANATFFDVFAGGASVALKFENLFSKVIINDKNVELKHVYNAIKEKPRELIDLLGFHESNHSKDYFYKIREMDRMEPYNKDNFVEKAARTIYLNKTCYNGLFRVNSKGYFNVPLGRQKKISIFDENNILELSKVFKKFTILNEDFSVVLDQCKSGDVVYLDPPYDKINSSSFVQYNAIAFDEFDQRRLVVLIDKLTEKGVYVIASNSYTENTKKLYKKYLNADSIIYVKRSIASNNHSRLPIKEILIDNIDEVNKNENQHH